MTHDTSIGFAKSLGFHALIVVLLLLFAYAVNEQIKEAPRVFELAAGGGNDSGATVAPALGVPGGAKLTVPALPTPKPEPAPVVQEEPAPAPVKPAPAPPKAPPAPATPAKKTTPDFGKQIQRAAIIAESRTKQQLAREHVAEAKRLAKEKEEADRAKQAKAAKFTPIDSEGIRQGVVRGSTANKTGGAGGKALTAEEGTAMERYFTMLKSRLLDALDRPAGLSDTLVATVEFRIGAGGTLSGARIKKTSGSAEFDRAALEACSRMSPIGSRPDGRNSELVEVDFKMKEQDGG